MTELQEKYASRIVVFDTNDKISSLSEWQKEYGLTGTQIGKHFSYMEPKFMQDIQDYGKLMICKPLVKLIDRYRELKGTPVKVNSFNRNQAKQKFLHEAGFKAATTSPHVAYLAADLDTLNDGDTYHSVELMKRAASELDYDIRIGYRQYMEVGQTFMHVDVCPMFYAEGKIRHEDNHPTVWERSITW